MSSGLMRRARQNMEKKHAERQAQHRTTQRDMEEYHNRIRNTDDVGELLKIHRRNEDLIETMEQSQKKEKRREPL